MPSDQVNADHVSRLRAALHNMRFRALESNIEAKENMREAYDKRRAGGLPNAKIGDVVCIHRPTRALRKLNFQWTDPNYVVVAIHPSVYVLRDLAPKGGIKLSEIRKQDKLPSTVVNIKSTSAYPVPDSFFLGAKVVKKFGHKWFVGTVDEVDSDE